MMMKREVLPNGRGWAMEVGGGQRAIHTSMEIVQESSGNITTTQRLDFSRSHPEVPLVVDVGKFRRNSTENPFNRDAGSTKSPIKFPNE